MKICQFCSSFGGATRSSVINIDEEFGKVGRLENLELLPLFSSRLLEDFMNFLSRNLTEYEMRVPSRIDSMM